MTDAAGLYLHVPFCASICPYCDFAVARGDRPARDRFTAALVREIAAAAALGVGPFDTVYLGGGTPSCLTPRQLETVLDACRSLLPLEDAASVVMEANPEDVTPLAVAAWRDLGVGGVSLGVQSFDDAVLRFLGRGHRGEDARRAVELALDAGFAWVSLDLIYGSLGVSAGSTRGGAGWDPSAVALADVATAIGFGPHHVSAYQLTVHDGTPFAAARARGRLRELDVDAQATLFLAVHQALASGGYPAYEVSNFARGTEHRSRHNTKYWNHTPYLGLGPSAHSFDGSARWWNLREWRRWAGAVESGASAVDDREALGPRELALEALMLSLRTTDGIATDAFEERFGVDLVERNRRHVEDAVEEGLLLLQERRLRPTLRGLAVADALTASFEL